MQTDNRKKNNNITYTLKHKLCLGCGVCESACPVSAINIDEEKGEYKPRLDNTVCLGDKCGKCLKVCPGIGVKFDSFIEDITENNAKIDKYIGRYNTIYTGYSCDNDIRYHSASGGMVTSFLIFLLEKRIIDGAIVTKYSDLDHLTPEVFIARNKEELLSSRGSKYCPVSMGKVKSLISNVEGKYVIVGLPCHIQGLRKLIKIDKKIRDKILGLFSIYCSSNRNFYARDYLLKTNNIQPENVSYFAFRDNGCLGDLTVKHREGTELRIPFEKYYPQLRSYFKPRRCLSCIDHYGELADVSFGDIHIEPYSNDHIGINSWIVRNSFWNDLFCNAASEGYIKMQPLMPEILNKSQATMLFPKKRRAKAVMNMDKLLFREIAVYDKVLKNPSVVDYIKEIICQLQRFIGRRPFLWFFIKVFNKN